MKTIHLRCATARHATLFLILFLTALNLWAQTPGAPGNTAAPEKEVAGYTYNFPGVDVNQVLDVYANLVGRTMLRAGLPNASITLKTQTPLTKTEAIEALQAVLALNGIAVVNIGDKFVKVLSPDQANAAGGEFNEVPANQLPDLGSYVTHIVQLKYVKPSVMVPIIQPFSRLPNSITPIDDNGILVIRDYAENVKRMLEMIDKIDVSVPAVYISEVIPDPLRASRRHRQRAEQPRRQRRRNRLRRQFRRQPDHQRTCEPQRRNGIWRNGRHVSIRCQQHVRQHIGPAAHGQWRDKSERHAVIVHSLSAAAAEHHQPRGCAGRRWRRRRTTANPDFWPGQNHRR